MSRSEYMTDLNKQSQFGTGLVDLNAFGRKNYGKVRQIVGVKTKPIRSVPGLVMLQRREIAAVLRAPQ